MAMTKEECEKALETIGYWPLWDSERTESGMWKVKDASCDEYKVIEKLINEHFDNPPLSFDDLKEGMWVWDDLKKRYDRIIVLDVATTSRLVIEMAGSYELFEENRFYRKQKED